MKSTFTRVAFLALFLLIFTGCKMYQSAPRPTIPLVEKIINNAQSPEYQVLARFDPQDTHGDIVILDSPERSLSLSERLVTCDDHDNVDGKPSQDMLPDFAGECITTVIDLVYTPYDRFLSADNASALREITVRSAVSALDTACCLGPFDHEKRSRKRAAKLLLLSSPYMAAYGAFDVDTLLRSTGAQVPVLSGPEVMLERVMDAHPGAVSIGVLTDSLTSVSGVYPLIFKELCRKRGDVYSTLFTFRVPDEASSDSLVLSAARLSSDLFKMILDQYSAAGKSSPLTALVIDDYSVSIDSLARSYQGILNRPSEENAYYRKMLAKDFAFVDGARVVTDACYRYLRSHNLFTHNIAYPQAAAYITSPEAPGYMLMDFDINSLPAEMAGQIQRLYPETYRLYVPDQHHARGN